MSAIWESAVRHVIGRERKCKERHTENKKRTKKLEDWRNSCNDRCDIIVTTPRTLAIRGILL